MLPEHSGLRINGQLFYYAAVSLLALLSVMENYLVYGGLFLAAILLLKKFKHFPVRLLVLLTGCYLLFIAAGYYEKVNFTTRYEGSEKDFLILFDDGVQIDGDSLFAYAKTLPSNEKMAVSYRIKTEKEKKFLQTLFKPGAACKTSGILEKPSPARNPNAFNYQSYLQRKQITWIIRIDKLMTHTCHYESKWVITALKSFRKEEVTKLESSFPSEAAALTAALIFGERSLFNPETERSYQKIGIVHLLAISGLHVALLAGMIFYLSIRAGITKEMSKRILLIFLPLYAVLTGLSPPVMRSVAMLMLLIGSRSLNLKLTPLDAVSIAFLSMAGVQPSIIYDIGFQLSFTVSFSLVISAPKILTHYSSFIKQTAAASFIAQFTSLPVILSVFYEVSIISLFANLLFVPLFSFILLPFLLFSYILFTLSGGLPDVYLSFMENLVHTINRLANYLAEIEFSSMTIGKPGITILLVQIFIIPLFFILWERFIANQTKLPAWFLMMPFLLLVIQILLPNFDPNGKIIFLDVGQGDSVFIKLPFNKGNYLIDTGGVIPFEEDDWQRSHGKFDPGKDIVVPFLKSEGIGTLDKLILTHGDADHIGGADALLSEINVKQLILPKGANRSTLEKEIVKKALMGRTDVYYAGAGTRWKTDGGEFTVLNPIENKDDRNEQSIVLHVILGGKKWLFTGDLGMEGERDLLKKYGAFDIDVLKVGHHGSKYSSSELFIENMHAEYAVISVGAKNRYGHPGKEVIERLESSSIQIYRTDIHGAVIYRFKGNKGTFSTQVP